MCMQEHFTSKNLNKVAISDVFFNPKKKIKYKKKMELWSQFSELICYVISLESYRFHKVSIIMNGYEMIFVYLNNKCISVINASIFKL